MAQTSTAISDFVLAISAFYVAKCTYVPNIYFAEGIALQGLAASAGVVRFGQSSPSDSVVSGHKFLSWLTTVLGLALMSAGSHYRHGNPILAQLLMLTAAGFTLSSRFIKGDIKTLLTQALSGFSLLSLLGLYAARGSVYGITACVLYILSGSLVGSDGQWSGIPRVDLLHYGLTLGNLAFLWALI